MGKYIVRQTKGVKSFAVKEITHTNISSLENAIALAKEVGAEYVEEIFKWWNGTPLTIKIWKNENAE